MAVRITKLRKMRKLPPKKERVAAKVRRSKADRIDELDRPDGGAHKRLTTLGQERIDELTARMVEGEKLTTLVDHIQKEWKELTDIKPITLLKELSRFRKDRVDGKLMYLANTEYGELVANRFAKNIDVLENLTNLVQIQQERVTKVLQAEERFAKSQDGKVARAKGTDIFAKFRVLLRGTTHEIEVLSALYGQLSNLQMDLGLVRRVPKELRVANIEQAASKAQEAIENAMATNKNVTHALTKAFALIEGEFSPVDDDAGITSPDVR